jgi:sugar transferase EpsL
MHEAPGQPGLSEIDRLAIPRQAPSPESSASTDGVQNSSALAVHTGPSQEHKTTRWRYPGKRALDLAILVLVAMPALMIGLISALAILLDDGGPVLFRQVRSGRDGRPFVLLKLRTMTNRQRRDDGYPEPSEITCTGRILRRTSIDELPQLLNVLRGDMSIVGPRPTLPQQVQRYDSRQFGRLNVQPGLTGLAQVNGRNQMTWAERIEWDLRYVEKQCLRLDLKVLAATARAVLTGDGVSGHPHHDPIARSE